MAQEQRNRFVEWLLLVREQAPALRERLASWVAAVREEPWVFWDTTAVRYATYGVGGLILVIIVSRLPSMIAPPPPPDARAAATSADYHVICTNPDCGLHFVVREKFGFHGFPLRCPRCKERTGERALRCNSKACKGRWVVPQEIEGRARCPYCGNDLGPAP